MDYTSTIEDIIENIIEREIRGLLSKINGMEEQIEKLEKAKAQSEVNNKFDKEFGKISSQRAKALRKGNWTQSRVSCGGYGEIHPTISMAPNQRVHPY